MITHSRFGIPTPRCLLGRHPYPKTPDPAQKTEPSRIYPSLFAFARHESHDTSILILHTPLPHFTFCPFSPCLSAEYSRKLHPPTKYSPLDINTKLHLECCRFRGLRHRLGSPRRRHANVVIISNHIKCSLLGSRPIVAPLFLSLVPSTPLPFSLYWHHENWCTLWRTTAHDFLICNTTYAIYCLPLLLP